MALPAKRPRDLRLDFFRGLALVFIFIDHVPDNVLGCFTLRSFGFCDAAEVFIFISGVSAGLAYNNAIDRYGIAFGISAIFRRAWRLYEIHMFLFIVLAALISHTVIAFRNPMYNEEMGIGFFFTEPSAAIINALLLKFQPQFLDILPLYIVMLLSLSLVIFIARLSMTAVFLASGLLYILVQIDPGIHPPAYPEGATWYFNPFAWQFLFIFGFLIGYRKLLGMGHLISGTRWAVAAWLVVVFSAVLNISWTVHWAYSSFPALLIDHFPQISKTDLSPLRLINFLALAFLIKNLLLPEHWLFRTCASQPLILCGQHSLPVFCIGILLSVIAHITLVEFGHGLIIQCIVNSVGISLIVGSAYLIAWFNTLSLRDEASVTVKRGPASLVHTVD